MAEDENNEEEKFDFTPEGEGYFNLHDAILSARQLVRQDEERYLSRTGWEEIVWSTSESEAGDVSIKVILQFRRPDRKVSEEENGLEEFLFGYNGALQDRQVLFWPNDSSAPRVTEPKPTSALAPDATYCSKWGTIGSGYGQLSLPHGVAVAPDGSVYVSDTYNKRIQKFTSEGGFVSQWGTNGTGVGYFLYPQDVAVAPDGSVCVADTENNRIQKFNSEGGFVSQLGTLGRGDGEFNKPTSVAVAPDGSVYVADRNNNRIQKFNSEGGFVSQLGTLGRGDGEFNKPTSVAVASDGSVYVTDTENNRIQKFDSEGVFVSQWGTVGGSDAQSRWPGEFKGLVGVAVASDGNVYVSDRNNNRIQEFNSEGVLVLQWGTNGAGDGQFNNPRGIAVASDGSVYVADSGNNRIQKFSVVP